MVIFAASRPASPVQQAAAHIHHILNNATDLDGTALSNLHGAFEVIDCREFGSNEDAIAVLSVAGLMLKHVFEIHRHRVESDGDAQLLLFATAYLGRSLEVLEMNGRDDAITLGMREV